VCRDAGIKTSTTEKNSPWQNRTEVEICELKKHVRRLMSRTNTPLPLWDFCCQYTVELRNRIARPLPQLHGRTPYEVLTGNTPDVSEYLEFCWFQPIWFYEPNVFPEQNRQFARWIGIAHRVGQAMCYWVLPITGIPIARTTIQEVTKEELNSSEVKRLVEVYDKEIEEKFRSNTDSIITSFQLYREDENIDNEQEQEPIDPDATALIIDEIDNDAYDELLYVEPILHRDGQQIRARVTGRKRDANGNPIGQFHPNPMLNSRIYLAEFPDGCIQELSANAIVEAVYNQIDGDGYDENLFQDIIDHRFDSTALTKEELQQLRCVRSENQGKRFCTLKGWEICLSWKDGTTSWHPLSEVKNSSPLLLAKYAVTNGLNDEPAFAWRVPHTIKKEIRLVKAIKSRYS